MAAKKKAGMEWVGGLVSMPAYAIGEGSRTGRRRSWLVADGAVIGTTMGEPGALLGEAAESLRSTIERPVHHRGAVCDVARDETTAGDGRR